jgi:hypothetical protein
MKLLRVLGTLVVLAALTGVAYVSPTTQGSGVGMADAAQRFLNLLAAEQKTKTVYDFDSAERLHWDFVPLQDSKRKPQRKGLRLGEMSPAQQEAARALLKAGTSAGGYTKATTIMSLEDILHELEKGGTNVRDPGWYFFTIFGTPAHTSRWGWRVEGHHLSLNFVIDAGRVVAATPAFFGANPATVKDGPRKGLQTLPEAEDLAKQLFGTLDTEQNKTAHVGKQFPEIGRTTRTPEKGSPTGLPAERLTGEQRAVLKKLVESYAQRMPADVATSELQEIADAGWEHMHLAYAGGLEPGQPHSYRIRGPTFVIEFLNVQADSANNPANHIHSAWRSMTADFGLKN